MTDHPAGEAARLLDKAAAQSASFRVGDPAEQRRLTEVDRLMRQRDALRRALSDLLQQRPGTPRYERAVNAATRALAEESR